MSNLIKVYSPSGEPFELSPPNARDVVNLAGWSYDAPAKVEEIKEVVKEEVKAPNPVPLEKIVTVEDVATPVDKIVEIPEDEVESAKPSNNGPRGRPANKK